MTPAQTALLAAAERAPWRNDVPAALLLDLLNMQEFDAIRAHVDAMPLPEDVRAARHWSGSCEG